MTFHAGSVAHSGLGETPNNEDTDTLEVRGQEEVRAGKMLWQLLDFAHLLAPLCVYGRALQDESRHSGPVIVCVRVPVLVAHMNVCVEGAFT